MGTPSMVLPGQAVIPKSYGEAMVLYTAGDPVCTVVDGAPANWRGAEGRKFTIEPGKAKIVPYEAGRFILEHLSYTGVVRVKETETDSGIEYDIETAKKESLELLEAMDRQRFRQYVDGVVADYIMNPKGKKAVPEPPEPIKAIIKRRGYDLKTYGIVPLGWEEPHADDPRVEDLQNQLAQLRKQLADMGEPRKKKD